MPHAAPRLVIRVSLQSQDNNPDFENLLTCNPFTCSQKSHAPTVETATRDTQHEGLSVVVHASCFVLRVS